MREIFASLRGQCEYLTVNHVTEELYPGDPEFTLGELGVQFFLLKQFQDLPKVFFMFLLTFGVDQNVIDEDNYKLVQIRFTHPVHKSWECLLLELSTGDTLTSDRSLNIKLAPYAPVEDRSYDPWEWYGFSLSGLIIAHNRWTLPEDPSFFFTNRTGAPQGEELGLMKPLSVSTRTKLDSKLPLVEWW
ncbi:hypothetical protein Tco_0155695 [Tanacetum coccineum]